MNKYRFFSSILFVRISYKTIELKTDLDLKSHWKMEAWRAQIGIFQKMRVKNLKGGSVRSDLKNSTPSPRKRRKTPHPQLSAQRACEGQERKYFDCILLIKFSTIKILRWSLCFWQSIRNFPTLWNHEICWLVSGENRKRISELGHKLSHWLPISSTSLIWRASF